MKNFRVKCARRPFSDGLADAHISTGNFYNVTDVAQTNGIEYFTMMGDLGLVVDRPSHFFRRF